MNMNMHDELRTRCAEVTRLTRERDEMREIAQEQRGRLIHLQTDVTRLTQERDVVRFSFVSAKKHAELADAEVTRLTEALAAAERQHKRDAKGEDAEYRARIAAEARVRELEALQRADRADCNRWHSRAVAIEDMRVKANLALVAAESRLAAANALLGRVQLWRPPADQDPRTYDAGQRETLQLTEDIVAHLAAQPATQEKNHEKR